MTKTVYTCRECGYETVRWLGRCTACGEYNTLEETVVQPASGKTARGVKSSGAAIQGISITKLSDVKLTRGGTQNGGDGRASTGLKELDRVLNGGIVAGSVTLLGGDPGIGKSTLLLQISKNIGGSHKTLYVSGEESAAQIKLRGDRLGASGAEGVYLLSETDIETVIAAAGRIKPSLILIDSIQTMRLADIASLPGSVTQVRECAAALTQMAKTEGAAVILVGHVTKEGAIAGPKVLEHMVDTVLYFEGERRESYRVIRAVKNRFGATNETGVFEMRETGLCEISDPSAYMLAGRPLGVSGSAVVAACEGTRSVLTEVQALVCFTQFGTPRRTATGLDYNRAVMLIAVLEKRAGYKLQTYDAYINAAGGIKIDEPAADAGIIAALASCYKNKPIDPHMAVFGEVGLTGEMRAVGMAEKRVTEARRQGFTGCVLPQANLKGLRVPDDKNFKIYGAAHIGEMLDLLL